MDITKFQIPRLNSGNYFNWRYRMEMLLKREGVYFVLSTPKPANEATEWEKADEKAHSIISLMIEDSEIQHIRSVKSAKSAWTALKDFHERDTPGTKVRILREIMRQRAEESTNMENHISRITELFQKLFALGDLKPEMFMSAVMIGSLPSSYDALVNALEARTEDELTTSLVSSKIIEEWRRRKERDSNGINSGGVDTTNALKVSDGFSGPQKSKKDMKCFFCKKWGHVRNDCKQFEKWKSNFYEKTTNLKQI